MEVKACISQVWKFENFGNRRYDFDYFFLKKFYMQNNVLENILKFIWWKKCKKWLGCHSHAFGVQRK
jgi:hypothetical protein